MRVLYECCALARAYIYSYTYTNTDRRSRIYAYMRQITGKWPEQQISLIYFNFSPATHGLLVWILCAAGELLRSYFRVRIDLRAAFGANIVRTLSSLKAGRMGTRKYERIRQNSGGELVRVCFIADYGRMTLCAMRVRIYADSNTIDRAGGRAGGRLWAPLAPGFST